jgi:hypothetical protein
LREVRREGRRGCKRKEMKVREEEGGRTASQFPSASLSISEYVRESLCEYTLGEYWCSYLHL